MIVKEALANGRLAGRNELGPEPDVTALAAVLAQPWATVVLSGAATGKQLTFNLRAAGNPRDSPPLAEAAGDYWTTRSRLPWT